MVQAGWRAALSAGISTAEFWASTPYETNTAVIVRSEQIAADYRLALWSAWHIEAFARAKKLPKLEEVLTRLDGKPVRRKTGAEILEIVRGMNAALGGKDLTRNG